MFSTLAGIRRVVSVRRDGPGMNTTYFKSLADESCLDKVGQARYPTPLATYRTGLRALLCAVWRSATRYINLCCWCFIVTELEACCFC